MEIRPASSYHLAATFLFRSGDRIFSAHRMSGAHYQWQGKPPYRTAGSTAEVRTFEKQTVRRNRKCRPHGTSRQSEAASGYYSTIHVSMLILQLTRGCKARKFFALI